MSGSLHASTEQLIISEDTRGSGLGIAFGASLLVHLSVIALVFFKQPDTKPQQVPLPKTAMVVSLSGTNPQVKQQVVAESSEINAEDPAVDSSIEQQEEAVVSAAAGGTQQTATLEQPQVDQTIQNGPDAATPGELPGEEAVENPGAPGINSSDLNNLVTAYIGNYKSSLTSDWLSECMRYQNEHGVKSCPPGEEGKSETSKAVNEATVQMFRTYVTSAAENARASKQLLEEMDAARVYMEEDSVMGELSRQRYELALANYCQLNKGCRSFSLSTSSSFATAVSNEGFIPIPISIGIDGKLRLFSGLMSLSLKDGVRVLDAAPQGRVAPFVPYRFTATPVQEAEKEDEFKLKAPLFPMQR